MLTFFLFGIFILACFALIITVLLQPGKADAGALFTSSVSSTAFGPRGTQTILAKITIGAAAIFMLVALTLSLGVGGTRSVMEGSKAPAATPTPAAPATATPDANATAPAAATQPDGAANTAANANANTTGATTTTPASSPKAQSSTAKKP